MQNESNVNSNRQEIIATALRYYLEKLHNDVAKNSYQGKGWTEILEEISEVEALLRLKE
jgi:hypothetical protein